MGPMEARPDRGGLLASRPMPRSSKWLVAAGMFVALEARAQTAAPVDTGDAHDGQKLMNAQSPQAAARRLQWWSEARFGMFIHWGLYAHDGCHWKGQDGKT